jgi:hypothetical protein
MVLYAKGQPLSKSREMDGQMPFEEWIYGTPPQEVDFVRINGNRVIRVEIAKDGEPLQVFTRDVVTAMLMTGGTPVMTAQSNVRVVREGDVETDPNKQAQAAPPSLRNPGENLPADNQSTGVMRPVQMPKPHNGDDQLGANPDEQQSQPNSQTAPASGQSSSAASGQSSPPAKSDAPPANGQQPSQQPSSTGGQQPAPSSSQPPPPGPSQYVTTSSAARTPSPSVAQSN